jgi:hypothetical protein
MNLHERIENAIAAKVDAALASFVERFESAIDAEVERRIEAAMRRVEGPSDASKAVIDRLSEASKAGAVDVAAPVVRLKSSAPKKPIKTDGNAPDGGMPKWLKKPKQVHFDIRDQAVALLEYSGKIMTTPELMSALECRKSDWEIASWLLRNETPGIVYRNAPGQPRGYSSVKKGVAR